MGDDWLGSEGVIRSDGGSRQPPQSRRELPGDMGGDRGMGDGRRGSREPPMSRREFPRDMGGDRGMGDGRRGSREPPMSRREFPGDMGGDRGMGDGRRGSREPPMARRDMGERGGHRGSQGYERDTMDHRGSQGYERDMRDHRGSQGYERDMRDQRGGQEHDTGMQGQKQADNRNDEMRRMFRELDRDGNHRLSMEEIVQLIRILGYNPTGRQINSFMERYDINEDSCIDEGEFQTIMNEHFVSGNSSKELEEAFDWYDKDGNGYLDKHEIKAIIETDESCQGLGVDDFLARMDHNRDGRIHKQEFISTIMQKGSGGRC